jgi:hypothetical protein
MARTLLSPEDARAWLRRRYTAQHRAWLGDGGAWPLAIPLGEPTERTVSDDPRLVREWIEAWAGWNDGGEVQWQERQWPRLGTQRLPCRLLLPSALHAARVLGEGARFERAVARRVRLVERWSNLAGSSRLLGNFDVLADYADEDFERLFALLAWLDQNRASSLYLRQLPVEGLDTKWCDARRRGLIADLLLAQRGQAEPLEFHALAGLRRPPQRLRLRVLCPELRQGTGGLCDIEAPIEQVAALRIAPRYVLVVENLETGVALPELPGCVAFMKLGNGVSVLSQLSWTAGVQALYWGDIDTHGFACLSHARGALPLLASVLMDEGTLLDHRALWGRELTAYSAAAPNLTAAERAVFEGLQSDAWGRGVRLEQERIPWARAMSALSEAVRAAAR